MTEETTIESRAAKTLADIFQSGRPLTYIRTAEERRVGRILREVAKGLHSSAAVPVWTWSLTEEMHRDGEAPAAGAQSARDALDFIAAHNGAAIFHLKDFHEPLRESSQTRRRLRDIYENCFGQGKFVVISSPVRFIPEEIERSVLFLELRVPDAIEMVAFLREECPGLSEEVVQLLAGALLGLTL